MNNKQKQRKINYSVTIALSIIMKQASDKNENLHSTQWGLLRLSKMSNFQEEGR